MFSCSKSLNFHYLNYKDDEEDDEYYDGDAGGGGSGTQFLTQVSINCVRCVLMCQTCKYIIRDEISCC